MEKELIVRLHKNFEAFAHEKDGVEFWYARELQGLLGYERWENFETAIEKAKVACSGAKQSASDHFRDATKTIAMPKGATKQVSDIMLTRYACYLIVRWSNFENWSRNFGNQYKAEVMVIRENR